MLLYRELGSLDLGINSFVQERWSKCLVDSDCLVVLWKIIALLDSWKAKTLVYSMSEMSVAFAYIQHRLQFTIT